MSAADELGTLADRVGVQRHWTDAFGVGQTVDMDDLRAVLAAVGWPCANRENIRDSLQRQARAQAYVPALATTALPDPRLPQSLEGAGVRIHWEHGGAIELQRGADDGWPPLPRDTPIGYHRVCHAHGESILAVAPPRCFGMGDLAGAAPPPWGLMAQIYALRDTHDDGFGNFGTLARCATLAGASGADALAISPVHALFAADPEHYAPYSPSSRLCLNALYADVRCGFSDNDIAAARAALTDTVAATADTPSLINWPAASRRKLALLRQLHAMHATPSPLSYQPDDPVHVHACFEALHAHLSAQAGRVLALPQWPSAWQSPDGREVQTFAAAHADELAFHIWLQRLAGQSLAQAQRAARTAGMRIGLVSDLAVGSDPHGSDAWAMAAHMLKGVSVGAPPDAFNRQGQAWGLTTFSPLALRQSGYAPWLRMVRAVLRNAGGIRIDHAMGLARLWLVPQGRDATHGAYARMPADDLLNLLALESWRHRAIVIGEDLGTIPPALRQRLRGSGLLGMSVLWFERDAHGAGFVPPSRWPQDGVALSGTHDLPTLAGWWRGRDLEQVNATPTAAADRPHERQALWRSLHADAPPTGASASTAGDGVATAVAHANDPPSPEQPAAFVDAVCAALASAPAPLRLMPLEDIAGNETQMNVPGTGDEYPNWRVRYRDSTDALFSRADVRRRLALLARSQ